MCQLPRRPLCRCVAALQAAGLQVLGDAVLNHRCASFQGPGGMWNSFGGRLAWDARAIVRDDANFHGQGTHGLAYSVRAARRPEARLHET